MGSSAAGAAASGAIARKRQVINDRIMMANDISGRGGVRRDIMNRDVVKRDMMKRDMVRRDFPSPQPSPKGRGSLNRKDVCFNPLSPGAGERCAGTRNRGPGFRGCDREGAHKNADRCGAASRSGVASEHNTLGTCSALRGRRVRGQPKRHFVRRSKKNIPLLTEEGCLRQQAGWWSRITTHEPRVYASRFIGIAVIIQPLRAR
jgi:hypothetical protein